MENTGGILQKKSVSVVIRVRPTLSNESREPCIEVPLGQGIPQTLAFPQNVTASGRSKSYTFDYIFNEESKQEEVFEGIGKPVIQSCLEGFHCTVFCYGQTGAGKTYTMTGPNSPESDHGLIPRMIHHLYSEVQTMRQQTDGMTETKIECSFLEIYKEKLFDLLLAPSRTTLHKKVKPPQLRENVRTGVFVENLTIERCQSAREALSLLRKGEERRTIGSTKMNEKSSRSHSVFTVYIECKTTGEITTIKKSKLHLIDLAGSERQKASGALGKQLIEACSINQSLSCLGKVILSLAEQSRIKASKSSKKGGKSKVPMRKIHIHYRDSKLTYLLKNSLGGNSRTVMIANISPSFTQYNETASTLLFAKRTKRIKNKPIANENVRGNTAVLEKQVQSLRAQLTYCKNVITELQNRQSRMSTTNNNNEQSAIFQLPTSEEVDQETAEQKNTRLEIILLRSLEKCRILREKNLNYQTKLETLLPVIAGKERQFITARMALKLSESLQGRGYSRTNRLKRRKGVDDVEVEDAKKLRFEVRRISDEEMVKRVVGEDILREEEEEESEGEVNRHGILDRIEKVFEKIFHPEEHPTVRELAYRNIELTEHLQKVMEHAKGEDYLTYLDKLQQQTEETVHRLLEEKRRLEEEVGTVHELSNIVEKSESKQTALESSRQHQEREYEILSEEVREECDEKIDVVTRESIGLREENEELKYMVKELFDLSTPDVVGEVKRKHRAVVDRMTLEFEEKVKQVTVEKEIVAGNLEKAETEVKKVKSRLKEREHVTSIEESYSVGMIGKLKAQKGELTGKLRCAEEMTKDLYVKNQRLEDQLKMLRKENTDYRIRDEVTKEKETEGMRVFKTEKERLNRAISKLEEEIEKVKMESDKSKDAMTLKLRKEQSKVRKMRLEISKIRDKLDPVTQDLQQTREELSEVQGDLDVTRTSCSRIQEELRESKRRNAESESRVSQLRISLRQQKLEVKKLKEGGGGRGNNIPKRRKMKMKMRDEDSNEEVNNSRRNFAKLARLKNGGGFVNKENNGGTVLGGGMKTVDDDPWGSRKKRKKKKKKQLQDITNNPLFLPSPTQKEFD